MSASFWEDRPPRKVKRPRREAENGPAPNPRAWVTWPGGKCPIDPDTMIDIKWNNGAVSRYTRAGFYSEGAFDFWVSRDRGGHIIAYRLSPEPEEAPPFSVERLAIFMAVVEAISAAGLPPGFARVIEEDGGGFTMALSISDRSIARTLSEKPRLLAEAKRIRALNPIAADPQ